MIKEQFSREYHVVCNGTTNHPSVKGLLLKQQQKKKNDRKHGHGIYWKKCHF